MCECNRKCAQNNKLNNNDDDDNNNTIQMYSTLHFANVNALKSLRNRTQSAYIKADISQTSSSLILLLHRFRSGTKNVNPSRAPTLPGRPFTGRAVAVSKSFSGRPGVPGSCDVSLQEDNRFKPTDDNFGNPK